MNIKYFLTNEKTFILDLLEKELCINGISYVRIDNEVHFENNIIRVLDYVEDKRIIYNLVMNNRHIELINSINTISLSPIDDYSNCKPININYNVELPKQKKKSLKNDSYKTNLMLKRNKMIQNKRI